MDIFATIIVPAAQAQAAREAAAQIPGGEGMFTAGLSPTGAEPATHYISSGYLPAELLASLQGIADCYDNEAGEVMAALGMTICEPSH